MIGKEVESKCLEWKGSGTQKRRVMAESERHYSTNLSSKRSWSLTHRVKVEDIKKVNNIKVKESKDRERTDGGRK